MIAIRARRSKTAIIERQPFASSILVFSAGLKEASALRTK